ncbi:epidermal growth factor receptor kinase substrate 8-like protein 1, partial [Tachysurus ichikawai]
ASALPTMQKTSTLPLPSSLGMTSDLNSSRPHSIALPPQHLPEDTEKVMQVNDELLQRLTSGKAGLSRPLVIHRSANTSLPLDYKSPPAEVESWLRGKSFSEPYRCFLLRADNEQNDHQHKHGDSPGSRQRYCNKTKIKE